MGLLQVYMYMYTPDWKDVVALKYISLNHERCARVADWESEKITQFVTFR